MRTRTNLSIVILAATSMVSASLRAQETQPAATMPSDAELHAHETQAAAAATR